ncbi:hypothetical protein KRR38_21845 [Novosphingobium sp. G106]|uniref:hypothetical protein n=1 Tax=Novosphingobium sp. G106 TaxID=2849500 RepID=UPI001C2D9D4E|nr:hypothetical protein [Novosphingobium sp. G106]MBV1690251.1 hypothetical protein [Novosphingobium sp. G106]
MYASKHEIISAGFSEAVKMKSAVANAAADANVTMNVRQFGRLAGLLESLCETALGEVGGGMGDPRYWVPLEEYAKLKREYQQLSAQSAPFDLRLSGWEPASPDTVSTSRSLM